MAMFEYGKHLGLAFQVVDDILVGSRVLVLCPTGVRLPLLLLPPVSARCRAVEPPQPRRGPVARPSKPLRFSFFLGLYPVDRAAGQAPGAGPRQRQPDCPRHLRTPGRQGRPPPRAGRGRVHGGRRPPEGESSGRGRCDTGGLLFLTWAPHLDAGPGPGAGPGGHRGGPEAGTRGGRQGPAGARLPARLSQQGLDAAHGRLRPGAPQLTSSWERASCSGRLP